MISSGGPKNQPAGRTRVQKRTCAVGDANVNNWGPRAGENTHTPRPRPPANAARTLRPVPAWDKAAESFERGRITKAVRPRPREGRNPELSFGGVFRRLCHRTLDEIWQEAQTSNLATPVGPPPVCTFPRP